MEKVSDTEWKLGIFSYEDTLSVVNGVKTIVKRTQFIRVATDPATHLIVAWESVVETSDERTERAR
jgi:hypothetical protein